MEKKKVEMQVSVSEDALKGTYANNVLISHTRGEFVLDFMTIFHPKGILGSRVIVSPHHAKRLVRALQDNIKKYEDRFGTLEEAEEPKISAQDVH